MNKIVKGFQVDPLLWKEFKKYCIDNDISISDKIEELINEELKQ